MNLQIRYKIVTLLIILTIGIVSAYVVYVKEKTSSITKPDVQKTETAVSLDLPKNASGCGRQGKLSEDDIWFLNDGPLQILSTHRQSDYTVKNTPFVLEGVVRPHAQSISINHGFGLGYGDKHYKINAKYEVSNFKVGDTHWCFTLNEKNNNIKPGSNGYTVKVMFEDGTIESRYVQIYFSTFRGNIADTADLEIEWLNEPQEISTEDILNDVTELNDLNRYHSSNTCCGIIRSLQVGTIKTVPYQGFPLILMEYTFGMGNLDYYRVIVDTASKKLLLLLQVSPEPEEYVKNIFVNAPNLSIPSLKFPSEIEFSGSQRSLITNGDIPNSLFPGGEISESLVVTQVNTLPGLEDMPKNLYVWNKNGFNSFVFKLPDNTVKFYDFDLPGKDIRPTDLCSIKGCLNGTDMTINLVGGETHSATYVVSYINTKNGWRSRNNSKINPQLLDEYMKQNTKYIGTIEGEKIFIPIEQDDPLYIENWLFTNSDDDNFILKKDDYAKYPLILPIKPRKWISPGVKKDVIE